MGAAFENSGSRTAEGPRQVSFTDRAAGRAGVDRASGLGWMAESRALPLSGGRAQGRARWRAWRGRQGPSRWGGVGDPPGGLGRERVSGLLVTDSWIEVCKWWLLDLRPVGRWVGGLGTAPAGTCA